MTLPFPPLLQLEQARLFAMAEAMMLRVHAATVGDTPNFKTERRALLDVAKELRLWDPALRRRLP